MRRFAIIFVLLLLILMVVPFVYFSNVDLNNFQDPLLNASRDGDVDTVTHLLANGSDPNKSDAYKNTPLSVAAHFGQSEVIELLLKNGARIDGIVGEMSPLQCAVYSGHRETALRLIKKGANLNHSDAYGTTPLAVAASRGDAEEVRLLLDAGADVEQANNLGWRPLHVALRSTKPKDAARLVTVETLLEYGADPNANNNGGYEKDSEHDSHVWGRSKTLPNQGNKPVAIATSNDFDEIARLLKSHGGT